MGSSYILGSGESISFWKDVWLGELPLKNQFPLIFNICSDPEKTMKQMYDGGDWRITLRRSIGEKELVEWNALNIFLEGVHPNLEKDVMRWKLTKTRVFSIGK